MPILHDLRCSKCGKTEDNHYFRNTSRVDRDMPACCGIRMEILWSAETIHPPWHPSETVVIWENPRTGEVRYPGRNDVPIPPKYREMGYVRREIRNLDEVHRFEKEHNVIAERANFDKGSGRGMEDYETRPRFR